VVTDLLVEANLDDLLDRVKPRTVFNCVAYGAYSFEAESDLIYETNFNLNSEVVEAAGRPEPRVLRAFGSFVGIWR